MFRAAIVFLVFTLVVAGARIWGLDQKRLTQATEEIAQRAQPNSDFVFESGDGEAEYSNSGDARPILPRGFGGAVSPDLPAKKRKRSKGRDHFSMLVPSAQDMVSALRFDPPSYPTQHHGPRLKKAAVDQKPINRQILAVKLQSELRRVGCFLGYETGTWDRGTRRAMMRFKRAVKGNFRSNAPDMKALRALAGYKKMVCFSKLAQIKKSASPFVTDHRDKLQDAKKLGFGNKVPPTPERKSLTRQRVILEKAKTGKHKTRKFAVARDFSVAKPGSKKVFPAAPAASTKLAALNVRDLTVNLQNELSRIGCYEGPINGTWVGATRRAVRRFNRFTELHLPTDRPSSQAYEIVKMRQGDVCLLKARKRKLQLAIDAQVEDDATVNPVTLKLLAKDGSLLTANDTSSAPDISTPEAAHHYLSILIKTQLRRVGCYHGAIDGMWDAQTQDSMALFNYYYNIVLPTDVPARAALKQINRTSGRVCPIGCLLKDNAVAESAEAGADDSRCRPHGRNAGGPSLKTKQETSVAPTHTELQNNN